MTSLNVSTRLEFDKVALGKKHTVHAVISLEGKQIKVERKPLAIAGVIDVSGSMQGDKFKYAQRTMEKLIDNMSSEDVLGGIAFGSTVNVIFPAMKMTPENKAKAKREVEQLGIRDNTNLSGGMLQGFEMLNDAPGEVIRVLLMSDGQPNEGVSSLQGICQLIENRTNKKVTLSTFGYGKDHAPELLQAMARTGGGNFTYIETPDACGAAFGRELGGLMSCVAQGVKVKVVTKPDVKILEVLNDLDVDANKDQTEATISVDDVYSEERRHLVLKLELPAMDSSGRPFKLGDVEVKYTDLIAKEPRSFETSFKIEYVKDDEVQKDADKTVLELIATFKAAKAQEEALKMAQAGNFAGAQHVIRSAALLCDAIGTVQSKALAADLNDNVMHRVENQAALNAGGDKYLFSNSKAYGSMRAANRGSHHLFATKSMDAMSKAMSDEEDYSMPTMHGTVVPPVVQAVPPAPAKQDPTLSKRRTNRS